jgi:transposase InsO family protein
VPPAAGLAIASVASLSPRPPNPLVVPCTHLLIEVLRRPLDSAQYLAIRYTERLGEQGVVNSVGSKGDSYDNALAETIIGLYKTELIRRRGPWKGIDDVEYARSSGSTGSTTDDCSSRSATSHLLSSRRPIDTNTTRATLTDPQSRASGEPGAVH